MIGYIRELFGGVVQGPFHQVAVDGLMALLIVVCAVAAYERITDFPSGRRLAQARPVYEYRPGFGDVSGCRKKEELPQKALDYIAYLEKAVGCPIKYVSVGPERDACVEMF